MEYKLLRRRIYIFFPCRNKIIPLKDIKIYLENLMNCSISLQKIIKIVWSWFLNTYQKELLTALWVWIYPAQNLKYDKNCTNFFPLHRYNTIFSRFYLFLRNFKISVTVICKIITDLVVVYKYRSVGKDILAFWLS